MHIFFGYSNSDNAPFRNLKAHLPPWITMWMGDEPLLLGSNVELSLQNVIDANVDYVILFLGIDDLKSDWLNRDIDWARGREEELHRTFLLLVLLGDVPNEFEDLKLPGVTTLTHVDQSKEGIETIATSIVNHVGDWISERLREETRVLADPPKVSQLPRSRNETKYHERVQSVTQNLKNVPEDWKDLVESLVLIPFLQTAISSRRGVIPLNPSQYYQCILQEIALAQTGWEVFAVSTISSDLWSSDTNQLNYAKRNLQAVKRGVKICRLFILPEGKSAEFTETILKQLDSGVEIRVADTRLIAETNALKDLVIFRSPDAIRAFICSPAIDNPRRILSGRLIVDPDQCGDLLNAFRGGWEAAMDADDYFRSRSYEVAVPSKLAPGLTMVVHRLDSPAVTCEEAASAKGIKLASELKSLVLETSSGLIAVHLPGDGILSLRAVKDFIEAEEAYLADPETLLRLGLSPGTVSAVLDPVWSMPHLISRRVFDRDIVSTNNRTKTGYFFFDPVILTSAAHVRIGDFERHD